jgi:NtrC-family two-component system response regulator AlgB
VVDDEPGIRTTLRACIEGDGGRVVEAGQAKGALSALAREPFDLALVDLRLPDQDGLDLIPGLLARQPDLPIVVITAHASIETAVEALRRGAEDYLPKPFTPAQVRHVLATRTRERRTLSRLHDLEERVRESVPEVDLSTASPRVREALDLAFRAAATDATVLLSGETGTGKSVVARAIHARSARADGPFVTVNGAALTGELLASELFGHVRGAFTGATQDQQGKVDAARGGTLFLDEVGEVEAGVQAKLLRLLQEREYERVGETTARKADVRFLAATNRDLAALVRAGRFRDDLFFRLHVVEVRLPALRERPEDLDALVQGYLRFFARGRPRPLRAAPAALAALRARPWPGNLRELKNVLERAVILTPGDLLRPEDVAPTPGAAVGGVAGPPRAGDLLSVEALIDAHVEAVVARARTVEEAARILGIDRATIWRRRKRREQQAAEGPGSALHGATGGGA